MIEDTSIEGIALAAVQMYTLVSEQMKGLARAKGNTDFQSSDEVPDVTSYAIDVAYHEAMHAWVELNKPIPKYGGRGNYGPKYSRDYDDPIQFLKDVYEKEGKDISPGVFKIMAHLKTLDGVNWKEKKDTVTIVQGETLKRLRWGIDEGIVEDVPNGDTLRDGRKVVGYRYVLPADESPADKDGGG